MHILPFHIYQTYYPYTGAYDLDYPTLNSGTCYLLSKLQCLRDHFTVINLGLFSITLLVIL